MLIAIRTSSTPTPTQQEASILFDMQRNTSQAVLAAAEGMTLLTAQRAINGALAAVKGFVNKLLPFPLIS